MRIYYSQTQDISQGLMSWPAALIIDNPSYGLSIINASGRSIDNTN